MSLSTGIHVLSPSTPELEAIISDIVYLHGECIVNDNTMATFLPPLSIDKIRQRWQTLVNQISDKQRIIIVNVSNIKDRVREIPNYKSPFPSEDHREMLKDDLEVSGVITLYMEPAETYSFRGSVAGFTTSGYHRGSGIGKSLMRELEAQALKHGRWNLMLETTVGTPAVEVYKRLGWREVGFVKDFAYRTTGDGDNVELCDQVWFSKDLRRHT